jgi:hypothetical protein
MSMPPLIGMTTPAMSAHAVAEQRQIDVQPIRQLSYVASQPQLAELWHKGADASIGSPGSATCCCLLQMLSGGFRSLRLVDAPHDANAP